jgi:poly [ADP-ribose] polymerase 7/11/12/13
VEIFDYGKTEDEYWAVADLFKETMPSFTITSIERIQNRTLHERFHNSKRQMEKRLGAGKGVRHLFHGTNSDSIDAICKQGFDFRLYSTCAYGKGSYFARDAEYSHGYTASCNTMFLAEVSNFYSNAPTFSS